MHGWRGSKRSESHPTTAHGARTRTPNLCLSGVATWKIMSFLEGRPTDTTRVQYQVRGTGTGMHDTVSLFVFIYCCIKNY